MKTNPAATTFPPSGDRSRRIASSGIRLFVVVEASPLPLINLIVEDRPPTATHNTTYDKVVLHGLGKIYAAIRKLQVVEGA